jgi:phosphoglycerate dehydrogenase-like enzyme
VGAVTGQPVVAVAGPPGIEDRLSDMTERGVLPLSVRAVTLPGVGAEKVGVLWRQGRASATWMRQALTALPDLAWIHSDFVGINDLPVDELAARGVVVTNGAGNYSRPMAEWVILSMLSAAKHLPHFVRKSDAGVWNPSLELDELDGSVALFLGLGSVGALAAPMAAALGIQVWGVTRTLRPSPPAGVRRLVPADEWRLSLAEADFVVCALPLTPETAGMIDADALGSMKRTAWLVNVARGELIDEQALLSALDSGSIGGAVLDAFVKEPLPPEHPLWRRPNVLVIPHHTWSSRQVAQRMDDLFASQLKAWVEGRPLANRVDLVAGY